MENQKIKFVRGGNTISGFCPICDEKLEWLKDYFDYPDLIQDVYCPQCNWQGEEHFDLYFVGHVTKEE